MPLFGSIPAILSVTFFIDKFSAAVVYTRPTTVSDIPEGCVLFDPQSARFFTFSDRLLIISHAMQMYLVSNKVASN